MLRGADLLLSQAAMVFLVPFNMYPFLPFLTILFTIFGHFFSWFGWFGTCLYIKKPLPLGQHQQSHGHDMLVPSAQTFTGVSACDLNRCGKMVAESYFVDFWP